MFNQIPKYKIQITLLSQPHFSSPLCNSLKKEFSSGHHNPQRSDNKKDACELDEHTIKVWLSKKIPAQISDGEHKSENKVHILWYNYHSHKNSHNIFSLLISS